jgi:predicted acetyltransferase
MNKSKVEMKQVDKNKITEREKEAIFRLLQFSEYDFSEFISSDLNDDGIYEYDYLNSYYSEDGRYIFTLKVDNKFAGIALVNNISYVLKKTDVICMAEFFIFKKYRRRGYGKNFAFYIFDLLKGSWELFQHDANPIAMGFWESIVAEYTDGNFKIIKTKNDDGLNGQAIIFDNTEREKIL